MPTKRSDRTFPLSLTAAAINTGIVAAYDWAGDVANSNAQGRGVDHSGNGRAWTAGASPASVITIDATNGVYGLDTSVGGTLPQNGFTRAGGTDALGMSVGTGDYSVWIRVRMPTAAPATTRLLNFVRFGAGSILDFSVYEVTSTGRYHFYGLSSADLNWSDHAGILPGAVADVHVTRVGGVKKWFINGTLVKTNSGNTVNFTGSSGTSFFGLVTGAIAPQFAYIDTVFWARGLSDAEVVAHQADPYAGYASTAGTVATVSGVQSTAAAGAIAASAPGGPVTAVISGAQSTAAAGAVLATGTGSTPSISFSLVNNTGSALANETGATVHVYALAGALVVSKTGQTSNGAGVMTVADAAMTAGTQYRAIGILSGGAEFMDKKTAA